MQIDDQAIIQAAASEIANRVMQNRQLLYELVASMDQSKTVTSHRQEIEKMVREAVHLSTEKIKTSIDGLIQTNVLFEIQKNKEQVMREARETLQAAAAEIVRHARQDLGKTLRRAMVELLQGQVEGRLAKIEKLLVEKVD